ncbi:MAG: hypothetical protein AB1611_06065 [bacterium]
MNQGIPLTGRFSIETPRTFKVELSSCSRFAYTIHKMNDICKNMHSWEGKGFRFINIWLIDKCFSGYLMLCVRKYIKLHTCTIRTSSWLELETAVSLQDKNIADFDDGNYAY